MARKIILLSDGTGNSAAKVWRTNVWRVFESLDLSGNDQIAAYDDGVGTASFKPVAILGGAFGFGLKRNVIDLYKFACRNYRESDDEIYGFGFSRGAFTIRIVVGLIFDQGLVQASSETELHAKATAAYREFRANRFHTKWPKPIRPENLFRWLRDLFLRLLRRKYSSAGNLKTVKVRFLGLWDTVAAYGMPVEEMARGISQWIWPWMLPDYHLDRRVERACHALSVDDDRTTFHPTLWDESNEKPLAADRDGKHLLVNERISQVWFPGVHSNVGGGYPDDSVAQIPLIWILSEAQNAGIRFKSLPDANPQTYGHPRTAQDKDGRIYDPRAGLGGYYRYGPRDLRLLGKGLLSRSGKGGLVRVHESVLKRMQNHAHSYAPVGLPEKYEVVTVNGEVLSPAQNPYEIPAQARARWHYQEKIWNTIWLRRVVYFLTVIVSFCLFAFPIAKSAPATDELSTPLRWMSDIIRLAGSFLPSAAKPWLDGYAREPGKFMLTALALVFVLLWGSWLAGRIRNQMDIVWKNSLNGQLTDPGRPTDWLYRMRTSAPYIKAHEILKKTLAPAFFALVFAYLGVALASHALYVVQDDAGWVCTDSKTAPSELDRGEILLANGRTDKLANFENAARNNPALSTADKENPFRYVNDLPVFRTSELCQSLQVKLERNRVYLIRFESTESFYDASIKAGGGFHTTDVSPWWKQILFFIGTPLRRELIRPWYRVVVRIGGTGGEEIFLDPDSGDTHYAISEKIKATKDGELFLFVNDAVTAIPGWYDLFYRNNIGSTRVLLFACGRATSQPTGFHC
jgi:uncharacterized protein (DUF2235 family)